MADRPEKPGAQRKRQAPAMKSGADARREPEKLKENQQRLGVGADHRTADMKKSHRGTFP